LLRSLANSLFDAHATDAHWFRFARVFLTAFFGILAGLLAMIAIVDPYDSGQFPVSLITGITDKDPRFASASRGRDPRFDAAVFGNSHGQAIHPVRLSQATGLRFVQMTVPGITPREQLTLMNWFARHHANIEAIVLVVDEWWCTHDPNLPTRYEFPYWLYSGRTFDHLTKLLSTQSFDRAIRRVALAFGLTEAADPNGFLDYEEGKTWSFSPAPIAELEAQSGLASPKPADPFPAAEQLAAMLSNLPADVPVIFVMPPVYYSSLPRPGTAAAADLSSCKFALAQIVAQRKRGDFLDMQVDTALARDPKNFMDATHYRANVAVMIENRIAAALKAQTPR